MIRTLIWGFHHRNFGDIVQRLQREGEIDLVAWVGKDRRCTHDIRDLLSLRIDRLDPYVGMPPAVYDRLYERLPEILEVFQRSEAALGQSYHAQLNLFNVFCDQAYRLLSETRPELILFVYVPHQGAELIYYEVARALGIPILMVYPHLVPNRFFYLYDIEDFGHFEGATAADPGQRFEVPRSFENDWFYVPKTYRGPASAGRLAWRAIQRNLKRTVRGRSRELTSTGLTRLIGSQRDYARLLASHAVDDVDLSRPFVYFPLHYQPELTTSPLGGLYVDQLTAIERVCALLPEGWCVYAKENPAQNHDRRERSFFDRLVRLPNVSLVSPRVNTYELMRKCQFVATVTGTAGWEAICGGKPVLTFGRSWYRSLPGVFEYTPRLSVEQILSCEIGQDELEESYQRLMEKTRVGVIEPNYRSQVPGYSDEQNLESVVRFYREELHRVRTHGVPQLAPAGRAAA